MHRAAPMDSCRKIFYVLIAFSFTFRLISSVTDTLNATQTIADGDGEGLVSSGGMFELGFFAPGNSSYRFLGLWHKKFAGQTIVWVANREVPLTNNTGVLRVIPPGLLVLLDGTNRTIWSSNATRSAQNPVVQLLDNGNIVVRDANDDRPENFLWQSFDHPTDTFLPGMKFGRILVTGSENFLVSWKSRDDPAPGRFSFQLDPTGYPQILLKDGASVTYRIGPWNGIRFSGTANEMFDRTYKLTFVMDENEVTYLEEAVDKSVLSRTTMNQSGILQRLIWVDRTQEWRVYLNMPSDSCDTYGACGANSICNIGNSPMCGCLDRFEPKDPVGWAGADWRNIGCVRRANLSCQGDVFLKYSGIKLPDATYSRYNTTMTLEECKRECSRSCSCTAYTQLDINKRTGCLFWYGDLIDIRRLPSAGQDIYIRLASSETDDRNSKKKRIVIASLGSAVGIILLCLSVFLWKRNHSKAKIHGNHKEKHDEEPELPLFDLSVILKATDHFSINYKLGEGGFGPVYMGILEDGQQIAVKRLSKDSMQGHEEFKNEVIFIAKLQHRNLVRLLGCCIQGDENLLIYEYLSNKSLDVLLFDTTRTTLLNWPMRFNIINGIARGLLYLHHDSRLRIIHRDLKASNVLLDGDMNPKISDFGMARCFGGNQTEAKTGRVVGTFGYMSPEYAIDGLFSVKSDVFSFGVLVLEIVSGRRNRGFSHNDHSLNLLGHAWKLYNEGRSLDLADNSLGHSFHSEEVLRSVHVGLLCVQQNPEDRPTMSTVVLMLGNEGSLPRAKQPGFFTERDLNGHNSSSSNLENSSNEMTITMPEGR